MEPISGISARPERDGILRRIKLVGEPEAMAWVARTLSAGGLLVERYDEKGITDPDFFSHWPLVWVTRPEAFGRGFVRTRPAILEIAPQPPPCLVVVPPDAEITDQLVRGIPLESFDLVRERDEGPLLAMRLERLLRLQRRRSQVHEDAFKEEGPPRTGPAPTFTRTGGRKTAASWRTWAAGRSTCGSASCRRARARR